MNWASREGGGGGERGVRYDGTMNGASKQRLSSLTGIVLQFRFVLSAMSGSLRQMTFRQAAFICSSLRDQLPSMAFLANLEFGRVGLATVDFCG